jgi:hypothetical protein
MKKVTLFISRAENQPGRYLVVVNGEGFFESVNKKVGARIRGDDPWFDDKLFSIGGTGIERVLPDGSFTLSKIVAGSQLSSRQKINFTIMASLTTVFATRIMTKM